MGVPMDACLTPSTSPSDMRRSSSRRTSVRDQGGMHFARSRGMTATRSRKPIVQWLRPSTSAACIQPPHSLGIPALFYSSFCRHRDHLWPEADDIGDQVIAILAHYDQIGHFGMRRLEENGQRRCVESSQARYDAEWGRVRARRLRL